MTNAQLIALKAHIAANINLVNGVPIDTLPNNPDANLAIAAWYNGNATPDFWSWKTAVSKADAVQSAGPEGTTFAWVGNGFITRSAGEQAAWRELFEGGTCNPSLTNVRQAFSDIFSGTGNAASNRTHLLAVARRKSSNVEKLFAVGTGSTASPAVMGFEGAISGNDVTQAREA